MSKLICPKCGAELEDFSQGDDWGYFADEPFRCSGHLIQPVPYPHISPDCALNRTKSCGYFGLADLEVEGNGN